MSLPTLVSQILVPVLFAFALLCAMAGTVIALGLITERDATLRFFSRINAWVPLRARLKWAEVPRDISRAVLARREWFSTAFIAGGAFIVLSAIVQLSPWWIPGRAPQLGHDVLLDSLVWTLVAGGLLAIVIGVLLAVSPATLAALQAHSDHWISTRQSGRELGEGGDRMHFGFDRFVADNPRAVGWTLLLLSLVCIVFAGSALIAH